MPPSTSRHAVSPQTCGIYTANAFSILLKAANQQYRDQVTRISGYFSILPGGHHFHLLQQTCLVKVQSHTRPDDTNTHLGASFVSLVANKCVEFQITSHNPATLRKLSVMTIRQHLLIKTNENFAQIVLPPQLLSLVTLSGLAEKLNLMWLQGEEKDSGGEEPSS